MKSSFHLFVVITGCKDNDNMMLVVELVVVFVVNFTMNKMRFRVKKEWIISQKLDRSRSVGHAFMPKHHP